MAGLLALTRLGPSERDTVSLALGAELSATGLSLSSAEALAPSFASPWAREPSALEPSFSLPSSYRLPQPPLKTGHLTKFDVTTLFYIFYTMPRDLLQSYAAQELYAREWRFHRELKLWFKPEPKAPGAPVYSFFDINAWEKKAYVGPMSALTNGFLAEEDCRVRAPVLPVRAPA